MREIELIERYNKDIIRYKDNGEIIQILDSNKTSLEKRKEDRRRPDKNKSFGNKPNFKKEFKKEEVKEVKETKKEEVKTEKIDLSKMTVAELRELAREKEVKGYSTMKKAELLDALN